MTTTTAAGPAAGPIELPVLDSPAERAVASCAPLLREPLSAAGADQLAGVLKALADPARLRLLSMIAAHEGGEACVCDLTEPLALSQPTVSHHLKVLLDAGLVSRDKRGVWAYYRIVDDALTDLAALLSASTGGPAAGQVAAPPLCRPGDRPAATHDRPAPAGGCGAPRDAAAGRP